MRKNTVMYNVAAMAVVHNTDDNSKNDSMYAWARHKSLGLSANQRKTPLSKRQTTTCDVHIR